jgi:hypothetical protein
VAKRKRLKALPVEPPKVERRPVVDWQTGEVMSVDQHYLSLDRAGRRQVLSSEYHVAAYRESGVIRLTLIKRQMAAH